MEVPPVPIGARGLWKRLLKTLSTCCLPQGPPGCGQAAPLPFRRAGVSGQSNSGSCVHPQPFGAPRAPISMSQLSAWHGGGKEGLRASEVRKEASQGRKLRGLACVSRPVL